MVELQHGERSGAHIFRTGRFVTAAVTANGRPRELYRLYAMVRAEAGCICIARRCCCIPVLKVRSKNNVSPKDRRGMSCRVDSVLQVLLNFTFQFRCTGKNRCAFPFEKQLK